MSRENTYRVWYLDRRGDKDYDLVTAPSREEAWWTIHDRRRPIFEAWVDDVEVPDGKTDRL
jgi:hypothetical protein